MTEYLKVVFVPGLLPDKWFRRFDERHGERPRGRTRRQIATSRDQQDTPYTVRIASAVVDDPLPYVLREHADVAFIRMDGRGRDGVVSDAEARGKRIHLIELYEEQPGVAVPKDHPMSLFPAVGMRDLEDEKIMWQPAMPHGAVSIPDVRAALDVVAANVGIVIAPRPLLKVMNKRGVVDVALDDGHPTQLAMVWLQARDNEDIQNLVGIVRGRTPRSSR
ncbi:LysR family transcriptional regulator substrate-binding protein [Corynebacterium kroppenstedtii]|uniref:LysR family transcriptional regulator substrate-binding protein n=1 Tax=Corynebacterium sp. PCR 32 TaxID=3351342 RepID=UPI0030B3C0D6